MESKINLGFKEKEHIYYDKDTNIEYTSATTVIGKYDKKFDTYYWAMYTALKNSHISVKPDYDNYKIVVGRVPTHVNELYNNSLYYDLAENLKIKWKKETKKSHKRGNKVHDYLEDSINKSRGDEVGKDNEAIKPLKSQLSNSFVNEDGVVELSNKNDLDQTDLGDTYPSIYEELLGYINRGCIILAEKKIYTSKYYIAGMIDVLVVKPKTKEFAILDWKTNKDEMMFIPGYYKKVKQGNLWVKGNEFIRTKDTLLYPLNDVPKAKGIKYSLQLSLYAYIMELWGYKLVKNGLWIFHMRPNRKPKRIKIKYYKKSIHKMLEHHLRERVNVKRDFNKYPMAPKEAFGKPSNNKFKFGMK